MKSKARNIIIEEDYDKCPYKVKIMAHRDMVFDKRLKDRDKIIYLMLLYAAGNIERSIRRSDLIYAKGYKQYGKIASGLRNLKKYGYIDYDTTSYKIFTIKNSHTKARDLFKIPKSGT